MHKRAFEIDEASGEPALIQHIDSQGLHPRAFAIDATGSLLVAANLAPTIIEHDGSRRDVPAGLAMFRIGNDGLLSRSDLSEAGCRDRGPRAKSGADGRRSDFRPAFRR